MFGWIDIFSDWLLWCDHIHYCKRVMVYWLQPAYPVRCVPVLELYSFLQQSHFPSFSSLLLDEYLLSAEHWCSEQLAVWSVHPAFSVPDVLCNSKPKLDIPVVLPLQCCCAPLSCCAAAKLCFVAVLTCPRRWPQPFPSLCALTHILVLPHHPWTASPVSHYLPVAASSPRVCVCVRMGTPSGWWVDLGLDSLTVVFISHDHWFFSMKD